MGWRMSALCLVALGACADAKRAPPASEEQAKSAAAGSEAPAKVVPIRPLVAAKGEKGSAAARPTGLRDRLERIFHSLPPPEALESAEPCDPRMSPTDGSELAVLDVALLEVLGTRVSAADLAGREAGLAAQVEAWRGLSSPIFDEVHRLALEGGDPEREATLEQEAAALFAGDRLGVMLSEERSVDPGRYRGWLVMYAMGSELPWCWIRIEAEAAPSSIEATVQGQVSAEVEKIAPGARLRWGRSSAPS